MKTAHFEITGYAPLLNLVDTDNVSTYNAKNFIPFGEDNLFPQQIAHISREVALHRALLNSKSFYIAGKEFTSANAKLLSFLQKINNNDETLKDVFYKLIYDELNIGNSYFEIVTDSRKSFVMFYHLDGLTVRLTKDKNVVLHPDWASYSGIKDSKLRTISLWPKFTKDGKFYRSVFHLKQYESQFYFYGIPSWFSGLRSIIIAGLTNIWNQNRLENQFNASGLLIIPGVNTDDDAEALEKMFDNYKGFSKVAKLLKYYLSDLGPGETRELAQYIEFKKNEEGNWLQLHQQAQSELITIHTWFKSLCSFVENTGFDTNRIINEYNIALNTVLRVYQAKYITVFKKILALFGFDVSDLSVVNECPVTLLHPLKYIWELRQEMGLSFDKNDPKQCLFFQELRNTYGNNQSNIQ